MNAIIIIFSLLLSLGSSGWFGWTYYERNTAYGKLADEESTLSEEKSTLTKQIEQDQQTIGKSRSLESGRIKVEHLTNQIANLDEEILSVQASKERLNKLEEERDRLQRDLDSKKS